MTRKVPRGPGSSSARRLEPTGVGDPFLRGSSLGLSHHAGIWVESDDVLEEMGEIQSDGAGPATDVEEPPTTIEMEVLGESTGQGRGIWFATLSVVGGGALEHGFVPNPVFPRVARQAFLHELSVAGMDHNGRVLEPPELERFVREGYLVIRSAFSTELAEECRRSAAQQLAIDLASPKAWGRQVIRGVPTGDCFNRAANAPRLLDAVGQLVNPDAWQTRPNLGAFVVRFPGEEDPGDTGWHIDSSFQPAGDSRWFVNYRSKQRALLLLCLLSDVGMEDAPSRLLPASHLEMARLLAPAGEAGLPGAYAGQESEIPLPASRSGELFANRLRWRRVRLSPSSCACSQLAPPW